MGRGFLLRRLDRQPGALGLQLRHLVPDLPGTLAEVGLRLLGGPQMAAQLLDCRMLLQREGGEAGVGLQPLLLRGDQGLELAGTLQPAPGVVQAGVEERRLQGLHDRELGVRQGRDRLPLDRQLLDGAPRLAGGCQLALQLHEPALEVPQGPGAGARPADAPGSLFAKSIEHRLGGAVRLGGIGERGDRLLDAARVFQPHHLAARDAGGIAVDLARDPQQAAADRGPAGSLAVEARCDVVSAGQVSDPHSVGVEVALDQEPGAVLHLDFERDRVRPLLPGPPALDPLAQCAPAALAIAREAEEGAEDRFLQRRLARLVGTYDQVDAALEAQVGGAQRPETGDLDPGQDHGLLMRRRRPA